MTDGGRQYTITLRKGVKFHNGKEMTAADVVASLSRWGRIALAGKPPWKSVEAVDAKGSYEVVIHLISIAHQHSPASALTPTRR